jgi:thiamine-phosphate pyrophosphorylase
MTDASIILRILDAELNRSAEGLRVVEDYVRFVLDDAHLTELLKLLRHDFAAAARELPAADRHSARDTAGDVGTQITTPSEGRRGDAWDVCAASLERIKQSFRSLEEYGKTAAPAFATQIEGLRYRLYTLEAAVGRTVDAAERLSDVRLHVLVDGGPNETAFGKLVGELVDAGVDVIQLRDKRHSDQELTARGRLLVQCTQHAKSRSLAIINDRPDVAAAVDADGVQLGQEDMSVKDARAILGPRKLIGVSTHSIDQARSAVLAGANYIGVGPTFPSQTKAFDAFPGLDLVRQVTAEIRLPAFAIGGISLENLSDVQTAGATRIAVSSAIAAASSPADAVRRFKSLLGAATAAVVETR